MLPREFGPILLSNFAFLLSHRVDLSVLDLTRGAAARKVGAAPEFRTFI